MVYCIAHTAFNLNSTTEGILVEMIEVNVSTKKSKVLDKKIVRLDLFSIF